MADSTVALSPADVAKLKVVQLKRELKNRGLSAAGDKADLAARLLHAVAPPVTVTLAAPAPASASAPTPPSPPSDAIDSDELDSDEVLQDDIVSDGNGADTDDNIIDNVAASLDEPEAAPTDAAEDAHARSAPAKSLKREATVSSSEDAADGVPEKKISLNRTAIVAPITPAAAEEPKVEGSRMITKAARKIIGPDSVLELRAQRFGIAAAADGDRAREARKARFGGSSADEAEKTPGKPAGEDAKEARKARFGAVVAGDDAKEARKERFGANEPSADLDVLKKRAERFGLNVSKTMVDIEQKEKLEKRKLKFGLT